MLLHNKYMEVSELTRNQKIVKRIITVILSAMLIFSAGVTVNAEPLRDLIVSTLAENDDNSINNSYISAQRIYSGETIVLHAAPKGVDPSKCTYAFYFRPKGLMWFNLQAYSDVQDCYWSPSTLGDYEVCIKIKYGRTIGKKYFDVRVTRDLVARPYVSTAFIQLGNTVELNAPYEGGYGNVSCAFYYKMKDDFSWNTLSDYGPADFIKWKPSKTGEYDLCIKIADEDGHYKEGYYSLTVSDVLPRTPTEFIITVKSPIASPYFWKCSFTDSDILDYYVTEKPAALEALKTYVLLEYHFRTKAAGRTDIELSYDTYNGDKYSLSYDVTVDRNLSYSIKDTTGTYIEKQLPKAEQVSSSFSVSVSKPGAGSHWTCDISDNLIADIDKVDTDDAYEDTYKFVVFRKGSFTLTFTCNSAADRTDKYKLIYDLKVDDALNVTVFNKDGIYIDYTELPDIVQ